jgi:hypothetical protein
MPDVVPHHKNLRKPGVRHVHPHPLVKAVAHKIVADLASSPAAIPAVNSDAVTLTYQPGELADPTAAAGDAAGVSEIHPPRADHHPRRTCPRRRLTTSRRRRSHEGRSVRP